MSEKESNHEDTGSNEGNRDGSDINNEDVNLGLSGTPVC